MLAALHKGKVVLIALMASTLLFAACTSKDKSTGNAEQTMGTVSQTEATLSPSGGKNASETRTVSHTLGEAQVPAEPKRVITLTAQFTDHLLSLDLKPVGTISSEAGKEVSWLHERLAGTTYIGTMQAPDMEMMMSLKPDLILGVDKHHSKAYDTLNKIAPTVFIDDMEADWRELYRYAASVVNKKELAEKKLIEFDGRIADAKAKLAGKLNGQTVLFMRVHHKESRLFGVNSHIGKIAYGGLGLSYPSITPTDEGEKPISLETIPEFNPDHLFLFDTNKDENKKVLEQLQQNPLWKNANAVKNGNVYFLGDLNDSKAGKGLVLYNLILDEILKVLSGK
jgi:iron complex transport system substrate-binding protein